MTTRRQPPLQPRSTPSRCGTRGGGWRRSSSSSWWGCSSTARPPTTAYRWHIFAKYLFDERILQIGIGQHPAADRLLDGAGDRARRGARRHAAVTEPGLQVGVVGVPVDLPRHPGLRAVGVLGADPDDLLSTSSWASRSGRRSSTSTCRLCRSRSCSRSSAWRSTRPPTWPKSSAPESVPCRRGSRRRRRRWACRGG